MLRFLRRRDPDLAEDALSETFAVAVRRAADIPEGRELPWLYVVAEHVLRNLQRSRRRAARIPEALHPFTNTATGPIEPASIGDALADLPDRERILLTMTALEGLSAQEAADRMGIPYGSARNSLSSGRKRLAVVLAAAAVAVLVVGIVGEIVDRTRRQPLEVLASSLSTARIVHDVAVVSHDDVATASAGSGSGSPSAGAAPDASARYERWSDGSGDRTRVRLPGGTEVVAQRGETLRAAARQQVPGVETPTRRRAVREDLTALDATSPTAIAALLADPLAQRTAADGPTIDGHDTTTVTGRIADAAGVEHDVRVFVADDEPTVLRVRVRSLDSAGVAAGAAQAATVDFTAWKATPRQGPAPSTPILPDATRPGASSAPSGAEATASAPAPGRDEAEAPKTVDAAGPASIASARELVAPKPATGTPRTPGTSRGTPRAALASAPIVHVRQLVKSCSTNALGDTYCTDYGDRELWLEQAGKRRSRVRNVRATGQVREEWVTETARSYMTVSPDGTRVRATRERLGAGRPVKRANYQQEWRGAWISQLARRLAELQSAPNWLGGLPAGPDVGGHATRLFTTTQPVTYPGGLGQPQAFTVEAALDAATGTPRRVTYRRVYPASAAGTAIPSDVITLEITAWEQVPAGEYARLVERKFPKGARVREYD